MDIRYIYYFLAEKFNFKNLINLLKTIILIGFIIFEEITWNKIGLPFYNYISSFKIYNKLVYYIHKQNNKYFIFLIFMFPMIIMKIIEIFALKSFAYGNIKTGVILYITTYILIIPIVFIFKEKKKELIKFKIIRIVYYYILKLKRTNKYKELIEQINKNRKRIIDKINKIKEDNILYYDFYIDGFKLIKVKTKELKKYNWKKNYIKFKNKLNKKYNFWKNK